MFITRVAALAAAALMSQAAHAQSVDRATTIQQRDDPSGTKQWTKDRSKWRLYASTGVFYATGDYGTDIRTDSLAFPFSVRLTKGPLRFSASIPYYHIKGPPQVIQSGDGPIADEPDGSNTRETRNGFGDVVLGVRYRVAPKSWKGFEFDLLGRVKLPTGSQRKGLSTGKADYGIGGELSYERGKIQPFAQVQYRLNGDPAGRDYRNTWRTSIGANASLAKGLNASVSYDYAQSRIRGNGGSHSIDGLLSKRLNRRLILSGFGSIGLSKRADDFSIGSVLTAQLF